MKSRIVKILLLIILALTNTGVLATELQSTTRSSQAVLHGEVDIIASSCAAGGVTLSSFEFPAFVAKVRLGSPALYAGIAKGDKVLSAQISDTKLSLLIERNGKQYYACLNTCAQPSKGFAADRHILTTNITKDQAASQLKDMFINHDLTLIVDCSGSMGTPDCPGGLTRWQWCANQSSDLAQAVQSASSNINIVFFHDSYSAWDNVKPSNIPELFAQHDPVGGTLMAQPLRERLDDYFTSSRLRPLIILIVSDGMPQDYADVAQIFSETGRRIRYAGELTIVFLLIGNDISEEQLRAEFGEAQSGSIQIGGMFDVIPFYTVSMRGIKSALLEELISVRKSIDVSRPSRAAMFTTGNSVEPVISQIMRNRNLNGAGSYSYNPAYQSKFYIHQY